MTIHHIVHVQGLNALTDLVQMIYEKLDSMKDTRREVIDGSDPAVQKALNNPCRRWTEDEDRILIDGYAMRWKPARISNELARHGYDRTPEMCIGHMYDLRKRNKKD